jgi:hypothetical protein
MAKIIRLTESDLNRIVRKVIKEQSVLGTLGNAMEIYGGVVKNLANILPPVALANLASSAINSDAKTFNQVLDQQRTKLGQEYTKLKNAVTKGDIAKNLQNIGSAMKPYVDEFKSGMGNQPQSKPTSPVAKSTTGGVQKAGPIKTHSGPGPGGVQKPGPAGPMKTPRPKAGIQTNPNASGGAQSSAPRPTSPKQPQPIQKTTPLANQQKKSPYIEYGGAGGL